MNALNVLCAQLTRDRFAIAKFLYKSPPEMTNYWRRNCKVELRSIYDEHAGCSDTRGLENTTEKATCS